MYHTHIHTHTHTHTHTTHWISRSIGDLFHNVLGPVVNGPMYSGCSSDLCVQHKPVYTR